MHNNQKMGQNYQCRLRYFAELRQNGTGEVNPFARNELARFNISKDLKQALMRHRKLMMAAKQDHVKLMATVLQVDA